MNKIPVYVGLDYHQSSVQVCVLDRDGAVLGNRSCANQRGAIQKRAERYGKIAGVAIESCSGAADLAEELVGHAGWPVHLAHPGYGNRMKQNPDKTDYTDARMLADLERVGYLPRGEAADYSGPARATGRRHALSSLDPGLAGLA